MFTDAALKALKAKDKIYKVTDRDGMYVRVAPSGALSFRLDYRLNGRRETVYLRWTQFSRQVAMRESCSYK